MSQVYKTAFLTTVQEQLFAKNEFILASVNDDPYVTNKTVERPQAGSTPDITVDRANYPMPVETRIDDKLSYNLHKYDTGAILIEDIEKIWLSYDKRASIIKSYMDKLNARLGDRAIEAWSQTFSAAPAVKTTGTSATGIAPIGGGTGARLGLALADFFTATGLIVSDDFEANDGMINALIPANIYYNFIANNKELLNSQYMGTANLPTGAVSKIAGVNIFLRSKTINYSNASTPVRNAIGAAPAATDVQGILFWHKDAVCKAKSAIKIFADEDEATYQGSIISAQVLFEAELTRLDGKGICTIVQATS